MKKTLTICLAAVALLASCRPEDPDLEPVVLKGGVDMGLVLTREDGTTYKLYWAESNLCERGLCRRPEDLGDYYAWGETQPYYATGHSQDNPCTDWKSGKDGYYWNSYNWCYGHNNKLTRYCPSGMTDYWGRRGAPDDKWRMPTRAEWAALCEQCTWNWINVNGVVGYQVTADNGNSIFIPAAGFREDDVLREVGSSANYWSSTADTEYPDYAWYMFTKKNRYVGEYRSARYFGHSVRPVMEE